MYTCRIHELSHIPNHTIHLDPVNHTPRNRGQFSLLMPETIFTSHFRGNAAFLAFCVRRRAYFPRLFVFHTFIIYNTDMKGYIENIERLARENEDFRRVLYTAEHSQLVLMCLKPNEEIGEEIHQLDQFIRCESGKGKAVLDGTPYDIEDGAAVVIPSGAKHNIINTSPDKPMKLYTLYAPPNHRDGTVHHTKAEAEANEEHFDGNTTK